MKTKNLALSFLLLLFIVAGCNKDGFYDEGSNVELKKANIPLAMKGEVCMIDNAEDRIAVHFGAPDGPIVPGATVVKITTLYGNLSGMGKLDEQSWMEGHEGAYLDAAAYSEGKIIVLATYDARLISANGDYIDIISSIRIDRDNQTITGVYTLTGGSGRFENVCGDGAFNGDIPCWEVNGTLVFPDKK